MNCLQHQSEHYQCESTNHSIRKHSKFRNHIEQSLYNWMHRETSMITPEEMSPTVYPKWTLKRIFPEMKKQKSRRVDNCTSQKLPQSKLITVHFEQQAPKHSNYARTAVGLLYILGSRFKQNQSINPSEGRPLYALSDKCHKFKG